MKTRQSANFAFSIALCGIAMNCGIAQTVIPDDDGVKAVNTAQEEKMTEAASSEEETARNILERVQKDREWFTDDDGESLRIFQIDHVEFEVEDPVNDPDFMKKRLLASAQAALQAKIKIIEQIDQVASAKTYMSIPGTAAHEQLSAERDKIEKQIAKAQKALSDLLEDVDAAEAKAIRGATLTDRLNALMDAAIKKLDSQYSAESIDTKKKEAFIKVKAEYELAQQQYEKLLARAEEMKERVVSAKSSTAEKVSAMPLFGATVIQQAESFVDGKYQVAVLMAWSMALEESARAIVTGADVALAPRPGAKKMQKWLYEQDLASMIGPRNYIDANGDRWFLGIAAFDYDDTLTSFQREVNKGQAELFAGQMAQFSLMADVEMRKKAEIVLEQRMKGIGEKTEDLVADSLASTIMEEIKEKHFPGLGERRATSVKHPITGRKIWVSVYGINSSDAKKCLAIERINIATKIESNKQQAREEGRKMANEAAIKESINNPVDVARGQVEQGGAIRAEVQRREAEKQPQGFRQIITPQPTKKKEEAKSTQGVFMGDVDVSDDF